MSDPSDTPDNSANKPKASDGKPADEAIAAPQSDVTPEAVDPVSARQRQIILHDKTNNRLAYGVTAGFFLMIILLFIPALSINLAEGTKNILFTLLGVVATGWSNIIGYYFGSSAGSNQKSQTIDAMLAKQPPIT